MLQRILACRSQRVARQGARGVLLALLLPALSSSSRPASAQPPVLSREVLERGMVQPEWPVPPRCCLAAACAARRTGQHALVASLRTPRYLPLLRQLVCSLRDSNPGSRLIVIGAESDNLTQAARAAVTSLSGPRLAVEYRLVRPHIHFGNERSKRFSLNWLKLSSWNLTEFDAVINLDLDLVVLQDLTHLWSLPAAFAWAPVQAPGGYWNNGGGFVFLRPCEIVLRHMLGLLAAHPELRFAHAHAEQSFLTFYFAATAVSLPMSYNCNANRGADLASWQEGKPLLTKGGEPVRVLHMAETKPWNIEPHTTLHRFAHRCPT